VSIPPRLAPYTVATRCAVLLTALSSPRTLGAVPDICAGDNQPRLVVEAAVHRLSLCDRGQVFTAFSVRLASGGTGKTRAGDRKLPLGKYPLGAPRPSKLYGIFIPIGYPTPAQAAQAYTGGSVGVHGPGRKVRWLGRLVNLFDTTDGCVGIATDDEMKRIAGWVTAHQARTVEIR
jgi:hypothetical protein